MSVVPFWNNNRPAFHSIFIERHATPGLNNNKDYLFASPLWAHKFSLLDKEDDM